MLENVIDRTGGDSIKWNRYAGRDVLPMWVADMDFAAPPPVLAALHERVTHGVFGYTEAWPSLIESVQEYLAREYGWNISPDWLVWLPGLVTGLNVACRSIEGKVATATPVYPPFFTAPRFSGREVLRIDLNQVDGRWEWDWPALEAAAPDIRLLLLCHPHNPVGRVWNDAELERLLALAKAHDWIVCSDEIHCDLILDPALRHRPFATLSAAAARRSITLMAPSKTFNVPGLGCSFAIIPDADLRRRLEQTMRGIVPHVNVLGWVACEAALRHGQSWRAELLDTLRANRDHLQATVASLPGLQMAPVEATYLAWIDARGLGLADAHAHFEAHGLGLSDGKDFGAPGWLRLNFGCPPATLAKALTRLEAAAQRAA